MDSQIRLAELTDIPDLCYVHKMTWLHTYPNDGCGIYESDILEKDFSSNKRVEAWTKRICDQSGRIWVAEDEGRVVAFCEVKFQPINNLLEAIYILPKFQKQGIGKLMCEEAICWLGGEKPIELQVAKYNNGAINFYKKLGFKEQVYEIKPYLLPNGKNIPLIAMIRF